MKDLYKILDIDKSSTSIRSKAHQKNKETLKTIKNKKKYKKTKNNGNTQKQ